MKKSIIFLTILLSFSECFSQSKFYNIQVAMGITKRSHIRSKYIRESYYPFSYSLFGDIKGHFSFDIKKKFLKDKLTLQLSNNFTFGFLRSGSDPYGNEFNEKALRSDHFVDLIYTKKTKEKFPNLLYGVGYGIMNAGTSFKYSRPYNNNPDNLNIFGNLRFMAPRFMVGLEKGVFNAFLIVNYSGRDEYYNKTPAWNADVKLTVTFPKFQKISKKLK